MISAEKWSKRLTGRSDSADWLLMAASFLETIIVPIPIELVLIPYMISRKRRIWWTATVVLLGCIAAALIGYAIGAFFMQSVGQWIIDDFGWQQEADVFREWFDVWGFWAVIAVGLVPIPFQIAMLTAGAAHYPLLLFCLATFIARGIRYYGLALLVYWFGDQALDHWRSHSTKTRLVLVLALAAIIMIIWLPVAST